MAESSKQSSQAVTPQMFDSLYQSVISSIAELIKQEHEICIKKFTNNQQQLKSCESEIKDKFKNVITQFK